MKSLVIANVLVSALALNSCTSGEKQGRVEKPNCPNVLFLFTAPPYGLSAPKNGN